MTAERPMGKQEAQRLYKQYGRPLEDKHRNKYVAISPEGKTILGLDLLEVLEKASAVFGPDNFVFKVGQRAVGRWR